MSKQTFRMVVATAIIAMLGLSLAPAAGASKRINPSISAQVREARQQAASSTIDFSPGLHRFAPQTPAGVNIIGKMSWGMATCGDNPFFHTCTFYWDVQMTKFWNMLYGGTYSGTKAAAVSAVAGLACFPLSGPFAVVCAGAAGIGFSQIQDTLRKATEIGGCAAVRFWPAGNGVYVPAYTYAEPLSSRYCYWDA